MPYINEGAASTLSDLIKAAGDISDTVSSASKSNSRPSGLYGSSILKASRDLIMSFPVMCDNTLSPSTAMMINKAIERMCVAQIQLLFSASYLSGEDGREVLQQWHHNMNQKVNIDDVLQMSDAITGNPSKPGLFESNKAILNKVAADMKTQFLSEIKFYPSSSFSKTSVSEFSVIEKFGTREISRSNYVHENDSDNFYNSNKDDYERRKANSINQDRNKENERHNKETEKETNRHNTASEDQAKTNSENDYKFKSSQSAVQQNKLRMDMAKNNVDFLKAQLLDSDAKKANELVPSLIIVRFVPTGAAASSAGISANTCEFIAGVKARLIPCTAREIIENIQSVSTNKVSLVNFIRATTKEISFAKDFVAAIDQAKIDAKQNSKMSKTSPIWRSLQARSTRSGLNRLRHNKPNDASAITTLVVSNEVANLIKNSSNIDLTDPKVAGYIMESYNLMAFVLVNEQTEVANFLLDGEKMYQQYDFGSMERETGDTSYKKIINLISKINR